MTKIFNECIMPCFEKIWNVMHEVLYIEISSSRVSLAQFCIGIILVGVILSIFLSFVNINNVRSSYTIAERKANKK